MFISHANGNEQVNKKAPGNKLYNTLQYILCVEIACSKENVVSSEPVALVLGDT